jgi:acetyl-CoA carboxylase carboxyl transferase subunit beta
MTHGSFLLLAEWDIGLCGGDPLSFPGYEALLRGADGESIVTGLTDVAGCMAVLIESRFSQFAGTMGAAAGEKIIRAFDQATARRLPVIAVTASGGARLQEGLVALVQMGRTAAARQRHAAAGLLMIAIYRSPTTGGVYASWAGLADLRAAVAGATIGFNGPRVVRAITGTALPAGSHTAEAAYATGQIDEVLQEGAALVWARAALGASSEPLRLPVGRGSILERRHGSPTHLTGARALKVARDRGRPSGLEWATVLTSSWTDLHGTDPVLRAGLVTIGATRAIVIAFDRHANGDGSGRPGPSGYRLAQRALRLAAQLRLPVLTLVDTPGADSGPTAEAGGVASEIARTLGLMVDMPTVTVSLCVGEGGSGGAMALSYADRQYMLSGSVFTVIAPEAAQVILSQKALHIEQLADSLRISGSELYSLGVVDGLLPDDADGVSAVRAAILAAFSEACPCDRNLRADGVTRRWVGPRHRFYPLCDL